MTESKDIPNPFEQKTKQMNLIKEKMANVKHKIAIISFVFVYPEDVINNRGLTRE